MPKSKKKPQQFVLRIGSEMPDGSLYAGISPTTGQPFYTTSAGAPEPMKWAQAQYYASHLDLHGHRDWRVPTTGELNQLYKNRNSIGGFNKTGDYPEGWYWSSSAGGPLHAQVQRFNDGEQIYDFKDDPASLRCVRG